MNQNPSATRRPGPAGVVFDLDGTITRPRLDFEAIRTEIGLAPDLPILEQLVAADAALRSRAEEVLAVHESEAARESELNDGARALFEYLDRHEIPRGVVTRNTRRNAELVARKHGLRFGPIAGRDCAPPKPHPEALRLIARRLGTLPREMVMVGDYRYDIEAGRAAGMTTVLVTNGEIKSYAAEAHRVVARLDELIAWFEDWEARGAGPQSRE
ncbi:MAG: HAD family hydrolase [Myxococcales bacterium]|nr:HAD family hydrolase [Myxococcales bacterium]